MAEGAEMTTETIDKLYLEWSQFTQARTARELRLAALLQRCEEALQQNDLDESKPHDGSLAGVCDRCRLVLDIVAELGSGGKP